MEPRDQSRHLIFLAAFDWSELEFVLINEVVISVLLSSIRSQLWLLVLGWSKYTLGMLTKWGYATRTAELVHKVGLA